MTMAKTEVQFEKQFNGYDRGQVDRYIASLAKAYQTAYDEYKAVCDKYNELVVTHKDLKSKEAQQPAADIISKTIVDSEALAHKIIADANAEAARIRREAETEAKKLITEAYTEKAAAKAEAQKALDEAANETENAKNSAQIIIGHANLEASKAQEKAKKIVDYAHMEASQIASQAEKNKNEAFDILKSAVESIRNILGQPGADGFETGTTEPQAADPAFIFLPSPLCEVS